MRKIALILCFVLLMNLCVGCASNSDIRVTENQFWNGLMEDDTTIYNESNNARRFVNSSSNKFIQCIAIKDYVVYLLYDFDSEVSALHELEARLGQWEQDNAVVEFIPTEMGLFYVANVMQSECYVMFISDDTMVLGLGNAEDRESMIENITNIINGSQDEYDKSQMQYLVDFGKEER